MNSFLELYESGTLSKICTNCNEEFVFSTDKYRLILWEKGYSHCPFCKKKLERVKKQ